MHYRGHEGLPGRVEVIGHGSGSWYKYCVGKTYDVLIPDNDDRAYIVMDTPHNRAVLATRLRGRLPENAPKGSGLTIYRKYCKLIDSGIETNETATMFLQQDDWLWRD